MKQHIRIQSTIHGKDIEAHYLGNSKWMKKINKLMMHLISVRKGWKREDWNIGSKTLKNSFRSKKKIPIISPLANNSQTSKDNWQKFPHNNGQICLNLRTNPSRKGKNKSIHLFQIPCSSTISLPMSADQKFKLSQIKISEMLSQFYSSLTSKKHKMK